MSEDRKAAGSPIQLEYGVCYSISGTIDNLRVEGLFDQSGNGRDAVQDDPDKCPTFKQPDLIEYLAKKAKEFTETTGGEHFPPPIYSERIWREIVREIIERAEDKGYRLTPSPPD